MYHSKFLAKELTIIAYFTSKQVMQNQLNYQQQQNQLDLLNEQLRFSRKQLTRANKLKKETDKKAEQIINKGNDTANGIMEQANKQADKPENNGI